MIAFIQKMLLQFFIILVHPSKPRTLLVPVTAVEFLIRPEATHIKKKMNARFLLEVKAYFRSRITAAMDQVEVMLLMKLHCFLFHHDPVVHFCCYGWFCMKGKRNPRDAYFLT